MIALTHHLNIILEPLVVWLLCVVWLPLTLAPAEQEILSCPHYSKYFIHINGHENIISFE